MKKLNSNPPQPKDTKLTRQDSDIEEAMTAAFENALLLTKQDTEETDEPDFFQDILFDDLPLLSQPLFDKGALKRNWAHKSDRDREGLDSFLSASPVKKLAAIDGQGLQFELLKKDYPNFIDVIEFFEGQVAISQRTDQPLNVPPINLQGAPGIGKTVFVEALARALELEFFDLHISGMQAEFELVGGNHMWTKANAGAIATTIVLRAETLHPVILLDEICLLSNNDRVNMYHPLYGVLDKEQARRFRDSYLDLTIDVSNAIYITTTNNIEKLPPAIRSRLISFNIRPPSYEDTLALIPRILISVLTELNLKSQFSQTLPRQALNEIALCSPREIKLQLKAAVGRAVLRDKTSENIQLTSVDFLQLSDKSSTMMSHSELVH